MQHKANFLNNSLFFLLLLGLLGITSCNTVTRLNVNVKDENENAPAPQHRSVSIDRGVSIEFEEKKGLALGDTPDDKIKNMLDDRIEGQNPSEKLLDYAKCGHCLRDKDYPKAARVVKYLVERGADVNAQYEKNKWTPLHFAVCNENDALVQTLTSSGADVNVKDKDSQTPLHIAAEHGPLSVVKDLIKAGADLTIKDISGRTAYAIAEENKDQDTMNLLYRDIKGETKLYTAISEAQCPGEIKRLIGLGIDVNARHQNNCTALIFAAHTDQRDIVKALIEAGASVDIQTTSDGKTALMLAAENGHPLTVKALRNAGASVTILDNDKRNVLFEEFSGEGPKILEALLAKGEKMQAKDGLYLQAAIRKAIPSYNTQQKRNKLLGVLQRFGLM